MTAVYHSTCCSPSILLPVLLEHCESSNRNSSFDRRYGVGTKVDSALQKYSGLFWIAEKSDDFRPRVIARAGHLHAPCQYGECWRAFREVSQKGFVVIKGELNQDFYRFTSVGNREALHTKSGSVPKFRRHLSESDHVIRPTC
jgi:hypothetical protein